VARQVTDIGVRALRPQAKRYEKPAGHGLYVVVQPSGRKSYALRYRFASKTRKLTLPGGLTLAAARKAAADALYEIEQGRDPATARRQQRQAQKLAAADTFQAIAEEYFRREGGSLRSARRRQRDLGRLVYPVIGDRPIAEIKRSEMVRLLDQIEETSGAIGADLTLAFVRRIMNWHAARSDDFRSPIVRGMTRTKTQERARSRVLSDDELRAVWKIAGERADSFAAFVQFLLLTAARRTEAVAMAWAEIDGTDWVLPASRNKTKVELVRPLSAAARTVLAKLPRIAGPGPGDKSFVFTVNGLSPLGGLSRRKRQFDQQCAVTGWTLHDLRRTARSLMSRAGVNSDHAERCLGHVIGGIRGTYDRHEYYDEKRRAFMVLAEQIERIVHAQQNVVSMRS
jgi:integrase